MKIPRPIKLLIVLITLSFFTHGQVIYNAYAKVTAVSGNTLLTVNNVNQVNHSFAVGEYVIVMQMQDNVIGTNTVNAASFGNLGSIQQAGRFEVGLVTAVNLSMGTPTSIALATALVNTYNTGTNSSLQIITFRRLSPTAFTSTNNITGLAWNGNIGGVVALEIPTVFTLGHSISANGLGFAGGLKNTPNGYSACEVVTYVTTIATRYAGKGEGIYKNTNAAFGGARGKILTGGGSGNDVNAGGGGGGNFSTGGNGGLGWVPAGTGCSPSAGGLGGISLTGNINASRVYLGGGGGGGHENDGVGTLGGAGGGIILLKTGTLVTTGSCVGGISITANGASAGNATNDGAGGGGAAGSIVLQVNSFSVGPTCTLNIASNGGNGGSSNTSGVHGAGGGGGQGVVIFSGAQPTTNVNTNTLPGSGGTSCSGCPAPANGEPGGGPNNSGIMTNSVGVLPIELIEFTTEDMDTKVALKWVTANEKNTDYFIVERSTDGNTWQQIVKQKAAENSNHRIYYEAEDIDPVNGISYYRLVTMDLDKTTSISSPQIIDRSNKNGYLIFYPNPASDVLHIVCSSGIENTQFDLFDIAGKKVDVKVITNSSDKITIDISGLSRGVYILNLKSPNAEHRSNKIIVK